MAQRIIKKVSAEFKLFGAVFEFFKQNGKPEDKDQYWDSLIRNISYDIAWNEKFSSCQDLAVELSLALLNVIEARFHSVREYGDDTHGYEILEKRRKEFREKYQRKMEEYR